MLAVATNAVLDACTTIAEEVALLVATVIGDIAPAPLPLASAGKIPILPADVGDGAVVVITVVEVAIVEVASEPAISSVFVTGA